MTKKIKNRLEWAFLWTVLVLLVLMFASCKTQKPQYPAQVPVHTKEKVVERLVPYALPADSTTITALFECDSLNNVQLKELSELKTKGLQSDFSFNNGKLNYQLKQPPDTIYIPAKDSIVERDVPILVPSEPIVVYKQTDMQVVQGWFGKIFMWLLGLGAILGIILLVWKLKF